MDADEIGDYWAFGFGVFFAISSVHEPLLFQRDSELGAASP